ncbi:MAG TPA: MarR family transcriptional regulator [Pirellulales bacterium]|nr:MarR family transcriptional regulator [Pirellulales bacterium]
MSTVTETSDARLLELLRRPGGLSVTEIAQAMQVTATAVRQRLSRLMGQGLVERKLIERRLVERQSADAGHPAAQTVRAGRGRPSHRYSLSEKARRQAGNNYGDLALMLWDEIRSVKDAEVRRGLLQRIASALGRMYSGQVKGPSLAGRMESLKQVFAERNVPLAVEERGDKPVLQVLDCPYPELAEKDRGICAVEKMLFSELLATPVKLSQCRLEGHTCCQFETD